MHKKRPLSGMIAHRGVPFYYPENSLAGYKAVLNIATHYPNVNCFMEVDVRTVRGNNEGDPEVAVGLHDVRLDRTHEGEGKCHEMTFDDIACMRMKPGRKDRSIDFSRIGGAPTGPLHEIVPPCNDSCGDYRAPSIREILELTLQTNAHRLAYGSAVGICLDLKDPKTFPALAATLNQFAIDHPKVRQPLVALGVSALVNRKEMRQFWKLLSPEARHHFYETPMEDRYLLRHVNLHTNTALKGIDKIASAATAAIGNKIWPYHILGDPDPSFEPSMLGTPGMKLAGNFTMFDTRTEINAALGRQHLIWTDNALLAMQCMDAHRQQAQTRGR